MMKGMQGEGGWKKEGGGGKKWGRGAVGEGPSGCCLLHPSDHRISIKSWGHLTLRHEDQRGDPQGTPWNLAYTVLLCCSCWANLYILIYLYLLLIQPSLAL